MDDKTLYSTLAFAGVFPFLACALLPLVGMQALPLFGPLDQLANSYGLAIVCFLAGIHWGTYLFRKDDLPLNLMVGSNALFLLVWFMYVLGGTTWSLLTQAATLILLLLIDWRLKNIGVITGYYLRTRSIATTLASISLIVIVLS